MWRTYGKDENGKEAAGCSLVLSSEFFKQMKKPVADKSSKPEPEQETAKVATIKDEDVKNIANDEELLKVVYIKTNGQDRSIKNDPSGKIKPVLDELKNQLNKLMEIYDGQQEKKEQKEFQRYVENTIFKNLSTINFLFKSADYSFENEVRVIQYVPRSSDLMKYMEIKEPKLPPKRFYIESTNVILPFIRKIYLGPKVENHQHWGLYFDFEIRQREKELRDKELCEEDPAPYKVTPSDIQISKSGIDFQ